MANEKYIYLDMSPTKIKEKIINMSNHGTIFYSNSSLVQSELSKHIDLKNAKTIIYMNYYDSSSVRDIMRYSEHAKILYTFGVSNVVINDNLAPENIYLNILEEDFLHTLTCKFFSNVKSLELKLNHNYNAKILLDILPESAEKIYLWSTSINSDFLYEFMDRKVSTETKQLAMGNCTLFNSAIPEKDYQLIEVTMSDNEIDNDMLQQMNNSKLFKHAHTINLSNNKIDEHLHLVHPEHFNNLKHINCSLNDNLDIIKNFVNTENLNQIETLVATQTNINHKSLSKIAQMANLNHLDIAGCNLNLFSLESIGSIDNLTYLDISSNNFSSYRDFSEILNPNISTLCVSNVGLNEFNLNKVFQLCPNLKYLDLASNETSLDAEDSFYNESLEFLDLSYMELFSNPQTIRILDSFKGLKVLRLSSCELTDEHIKILASLEFKNLEVLDLKYNSLTDESLRYLATSSYIDHIHEISIYGNIISTINEHNNPKRYRFNDESINFIFDKGFWFFGSIIDLNLNVKWDWYNYTDKYKGKSIFSSLYYQPPLHLLD